MNCFSHRFAVRSLLLCATLALVQSAAAADGQTRLRVTGTELTYKAQGSSQVMQTAQATVQNVGTVEATGIIVSGVMPDGKSQEMSGPDTLSPNKKATYFWQGSTKVLVKNAKISASATCGNCRK